MMSQDAARDTSAATEKKLQTTAKELFKSKKLVKEKDGQIQKLKQELASSTSTKNEEDQSRVKELQKQVQLNNKKLVELKSEAKSKENRAEQLNKDLQQVTEQNKQEVSKLKKDWAGTKSKLSEKISDLEKALDEERQERQKVA